MSEIEKAGYDVQLFLLNGVTMGLPQSRERVFFICRRKDLKLPEITLQFNEKADYWTFKSRIMYQTKFYAWLHHFLLITIT